MLSKQKEPFQKLSLIASSVLIIAIIVASGFLAFYIKYYSGVQCYDQLSNITDTAIDTVEGEFDADRNQLRLVSSIISNNIVGEDLHSSSVIKSLTTYNAYSISSDIAILLPDNTVIRVSGGDLDATGVLDYYEVLRRGEHVSTLQKDLDVEGEYNLRNYVPLKIKGRTVAFLYTTFLPKDIIENWFPGAYEGSAIFTIVDRDSGVLIVDSEERQLEYIGNLDIDVDSLEAESDTFSEAILNGNYGFAQGNDGITGEDMFYSFAPMSMENWELIVSVPAKSVYAEYRPINVALAIFIALEFVALFFYVMYLLRITSGSLAGIERRANIDALTGLQNRNRYEHMIMHYTNQSEGVACIYFDVNGLHELNNTKGHLAGDEMLKTIASILAQEYGVDNTYRIGGDEFVAFRYENSEFAVRANIMKVITEIDCKGYTVAVGMAMTTNDKPLHVTIKEAEDAMYINKQSYYNHKGKEMR